MPGREDGGCKALGQELGMREDPEEPRGQSRAREEGVGGDIQGGQGVLLLGL